MQPQRVFFSKSDFSTGEDGEKSEEMNINIVIYGLSGVMCEHHKETVTTPIFGIRDKSSKGDSSASTQSTDPVSSEELTVLSNINAPTTAVVSYRKKAYSSQTALETFLPSIPLKYPTKSNGSKYRYHASWPCEQTSLTKDESAIERSSFSFTRVMKQAAFVPGNVARSNYVHETLELRINLSRGTELIHLGAATVVFTGEEEGEVQMIIPARPVAEKSKKLSKNKVKTKSNKYGFFSGDLTRRFFLSQNATLKIGVKAVPQEALDKAAERERTVALERERNENRIRKLLGSTDLKEMVKNMGQNMGKMNLQGGMDRLFNTDDLEGLEEDLPVEDMLQNLFCGTAFCGAENACQAINRCQPLVAPYDKVPSEIDTVDWSKLGIQSIISSVSDGDSSDDSNSEQSDEEDDEEELDLDEYNVEPSDYRRYT